MPDNNNFWSSCQFKASKILTEIVHARNGSPTEGRCTVSPVGGKAMIQALMSRHASPRLFRTKNISRPHSVRSLQQMLFQESTFSETKVATYQIKLKAKDEMSFPYCLT